MKELSGEVFGLNKRMVIREIGTDHFAIVKKVKSRIIRKDAIALLEKMGQIKAHQPKAKVSLICTKNICSKSLAILSEKDVEVIFEEF